MLKLDGNRTLAHSGGNELDQTVTHVAGYLPARLAQLVIRTAHSSQRMLPCLPLFAVHTGAWPVVRFGQELLESCCFVASQKTPRTAPWQHPCQSNPIDLLGAEAAPAKPGPPDPLRTPRPAAGPIFSRAARAVESSVDTAISNPSKTAFERLLLASWPF